MSIIYSDYDPAVKQGATVNVSGSMAQLSDTNSNESLVLTATTNAVNQFNLVNAATLNDPLIKSEGDDTNVGFKLQTKGTGGFTLTAAATTGVELDLVSPALTTGKAIDVSDLDAITTSWTALV